VSDFEVPETWPDSLQKIWRVPAGAGLSSPVSVDNKVYLLARSHDEESVSCYDLSNGKVVWRQMYSAPFIPNPQATIPRFFPESRGKGPFATPLIYQDRIYTLGIDRVLSSFNATAGELEWRHHFLKQERPDRLEYECPPCGCSVDGQSFTESGQCSDCGMAYGVKGVETSAKSGGPNYYGAASSPLVVNDLIVVHVGNADHGSLLAVDPITGTKRWVWEGPPMSSSSPVVATFHGSKQIVVLTRSSIAGVSADNGQLLWSFLLESNAQVVTPIVFNDTVIFSAYRSPTTSISVSKNGDDWSVQQAWQNTSVTLYTSTPVVDQEKLYGLSYTKRGQFVCLDMRTGETLWASEGRQAQGAAILDVGSTVMALTDDGHLKVIAKDEGQYRLLKQFRVAEMPTWAHPVLSNNRILVKDEANLTLWSFE
jgi:outer membrane protein assembly factor BamB